MFRFKTLWKNKVFIVFLVVIVALAPQAAARPAQMLSKTLVTTLGINRIAGEYEISGEVIINKADQPQSAERKNVVMSATAPTIGEAINKISASTGREVSFAHCTLLIIASSLDGESVLPLLTYFLQKTEISNSVVLVYTTGDPKAVIAASIANGNAQGGLLQQIAKYNQDNVFGRPTSLESFFKDTLRPGQATVIGAVSFVGESLTNKMEGAVFMGGKYVFTLDEARVTAMNFLSRKKTKLRYITELDDGVNAVVAVRDKKPKVKVMFVGETPHIAISVKASVRVEELSHQLDINNSLPVIDIEMALVQKLTADLTSALASLAAHKTDILNVYDMLNRSNRRALRTFMNGKDPADVVAAATYEIKVDANVYS